MSSFKLIDRRLFLLGLLASCGFEPALTGKTTGDLRGKIVIPDATDQESRIFREVMLTYFGETTDPVYEISFDYQISTSSLAVNQNNVARRYRLVCEGNFKATVISSREILLDQDFRRFSSYTSNADRFALDSAETAARNRLMNSIANEFATRLIDAANPQ